ncbi:succinyldiaminopimelate transaminase [Gephyromycinifex aptenodytis]|uniref:succinyldiaminopimelate transaminase n=1 Tax=Gephyromycinifex aptenodytis TaxID=2716227 RepID=UPI001447B802|nr:succinyldiaminopimelate transaminase [Gephyromycinifex aptenodytis]
MLNLPDFPWDTLAEAKARAASHPEGIVDLSVGTPVDPTPESVRQALAQAGDAHGYPQTWGTPDLREAVAAWFARRRGVPDLDPDGVLPTVGSKEFVAWLPLMLGLGHSDVVAFPAIAYPTYDVGARLAGATPAPYAGLAELTALNPAPALVWINSPSNPTGAVAEVEELREIVRWARQVGALVVNDECYAELDWRDGHSGSPRPCGAPSLLDPRVCEGSHEGLIACYSLSKQSNLAGYRAAFAAGDPVLIDRLLQVRKHAGMMMPWPVQRAMLAALSDDEHVSAQIEIYRRRRELLAPALQHAGLRISHSQAGLYLWASMGMDARETVRLLAERGILVAPGDFYGAAGQSHVRVAITATDDRIQAAAQRCEQREPLGSQGRPVA